MDKDRLQVQLETLQAQLKQKDRKAQLKDQELTLLKNELKSQGVRRLTSDKPTSSTHQV